MKKIVKSSSVILTIYFLAFGCIYSLIKILGYTFVPFSGIAINIIASAIIIFLTGNGVKYRNEKTKSSFVFSAFLPLISIFYLASKLAASDGNKIDTYVYLTLIIITLICSMIVFFSCRCGIITKIILGFTYSILLLLIFIVLCLILAFADFALNTVVKAELSPNGVYLAEIIDNDQGALGGATIVEVTCRNSDINILIGKLKKDSKMIYKGDYGEYEKMTLQWETDDILYINGNKYVIK